MTLKRILLFCLLAISINVQGQQTKVQFVNNCADINLSGVDIYVNSILLTPNILFRNATIFLDVDAGVPIKIGIAEANSTSVTDTFYSITTTLSPTDHYIIVANGIKSSSGYSPMRPFKLDVFNRARQKASTPNNTDLIFANGATELNSYDIRTGTTIHTDNLNYGDFDANYIELPSSTIYNIRFTNNTGSKTLFNFEADFTSLNLTGETGLSISSGFIDQASNNNGPKFGLWVAPPSGGPLIEIPTITSREKLARIQFINNCADTGVGKVDIYQNGVKIIDTLPFRSSRAYMDVYAGVPLKVSVAKEGSSSSLNAFYDSTIVLDSGVVYSAVLHGIKSITNYKPLPQYKLNISGNAIEDAANATNTEILFMHGSTDFPFSDIDLSTGSNIVNNIGYDLFTSTRTILPTANQVFVLDTNNKVYGNYTANLQTIGASGLGITVLYSGFFMPDSNSKGPSFGLWAALPNGGTLIELPKMVNINEVNNNSQILTIYPNPSRNNIRIEGIKANKLVEVLDINGKVLLTKYKFSSNSTIDISQLSVGNYIIRAMSLNDKTSYIKFSKY